MSSGLVAGGGTGLLLVARSPRLLTLVGVVIGAGVGTFLAANWALVRDIVPGDEAARYLGVANIVAAGGSAIARRLGGSLIDLLNRATGTRSVAYLTL